MSSEDYSVIHRRVEAAYDAAIRDGRNEHERVLWHDPARQYYRFEEIAAFIADIENPRLSILDIGCGNAEFLRYLNFKGFRGHYAGIDLHAGMIDEAKRRFPDADVSRKDTLSDQLPGTDVVVMSGIFNVNCGQTVEYVRAVIAAAFAATSDRVIFNAISTHVTRRDSEHFYLDPADAIAIAAGLSGRFALRHGFLPFNYTVCIHKSAQWDSLPWAGG